MHTANNNWLIWPVRALILIAALLCILSAGSGANGAPSYFGWLNLMEYASAPDTPQSGRGLLWVKNDGTLHIKNDAGGDVDLSAISSALGYHYLTSQAESGLSNEVNLGALTTGLLKHTVSGGVSTPATATAGTDYVSPGAVNNQTLNGFTLDSGTSAADTLKLRGRDTTFNAWNDLLKITSGNPPVLDFPQSATFAGAAPYTVGGTDVSLTDGGTGASTAAAANTNITGWTLAAVSGSNATTTNTTATDITGLSFACAANTLYEFEGVLVVQSSSSAGCKYAVQYSAAGASCGAVFTGAVTTTTAAVTSVSALNSLEATAYLTGSQKSMVYVRGWLQTGANTGNLTLRHAKVTSGTSTVFIGSTLKVRAL